MFTKIRIFGIVLILITFLFLSVLLFHGLHHNPHAIPSALIGKSIPVFTAESLDPKASPITNQIFYGHVSLLNVFSSWCVYCRAEHPLLMDIEQKMGLYLYGLDYKDSRKKALQWLRLHGNPYRKIIYDPKGRIAMDWGVYGTPETFLVDAQGVVRYRHVGPISEKIWRRKLLPMIQKLKQKAY